MLRHGSEADGPLSKVEPMAIADGDPGDAAVRRSFNPSGDVRIERIKRLAGALVNEVSAHGRDEEDIRRATDRITSAAMWAVRAVTDPTGD